MSTFILVIFILFALRFCVSVFALASMDFPYDIPVTRINGVVRMLLDLGFALWGACILWGAK